MNPIQRIVHTVSGLFGRIPEWYPHDHTPLGKNVPYGSGVEQLWRGPSMLPYAGYGFGGYGMGAGYGMGYGYGAMAGWNACAPMPGFPSAVPPVWGGVGMLGSPWGFRRRVVRYSAPGC